ncbi:MAG: SRPBCC family protein [Candidatus Dormibacteria bacterium]
MDVDVTTETEIACPRERVALFAAAPENATRWYANIRSSRMLTPEPLATGSRVAFSAKFLGRSLDYTYEIVEYIAGERLVMRTADGPFAMETTYEWSDVAGGGTRMVLRNRGRPSGFAAIMGGAMEAAMRRANRKDLARLKAILETEDAS